MADFTNNSSEEISRCDSMPQINKNSPEGQADMPFRKRLSTLDIGWLKRSTKRFTSDKTEGSTSPRPQSPLQIRARKLCIEDQNMSRGLSGSANELCPPSTENKGMGPTRMSESSLWKWFNTPMNNGYEIGGVVISEKEKQGATAASSVQPQQNMETPGTNGQIFTDRQKLKAMKDLNVLSPSHW